MPAGLIWSCSTCAIEASASGAGHSVVPPQLRAEERLRAVEEALLDLDADRQLRCLALRDAARQELRIFRDPRAAVDAQRLLASGNEEDQADVRIGQQVLHPVEALVAGAIGDDDAAVVEDEDEAWRIALGRDVARAVRPDVAISRNGERAMNARKCSSSVGRSLSTERCAGRPSMSRSSCSLVTMWLKEVMSSPVRLKPDTTSSAEAGTLGRDATAESTAGRCRARCRAVPRP